MEFNENIEELKERIKNYQHQVELRVLDNCPFIVQVGALTITTDETGKVITQNCKYPTQFTQKAVDQILTMTFKNGNGEKIEPIVFFRNDWYNERITIIKETLELIK